MPSICAVVGCGSRGDRDTRHFFRIPSALSKGSERVIKLSKERREKWIDALKRADLTFSKLKHARICDKHFINGCPADILDTLSPDWVPSKHMGYETAYKPLKGNHRKKLRPDVYTSTVVVSRMPSGDSDVASSLDVLDSTLTGRESDHRCLSTQTELTLKHINSVSKVINHQTVEIVKLKEQLNMYLIPEGSFEEDKRTKFYSGNSEADSDIHGPVVTSCSDGNGNTFSVQEDASGIPSIVPKQEPEDLETDFKFNSLVDLGVHGLAVTSYSDEDTSEQEDASEFYRPESFIVPKVEPEDLETDSKEAEPEDLLETDSKDLRRQTPPLSGVDETTLFFKKACETVKKLNPVHQGRIKWEISKLVYAAVMQELESEELL